MRITNQMEKPFIFGGRELYLIDDADGTYLSHDGISRLSFKRAFKLFHPHAKKVRCKKSRNSDKCYCIAHSEMFKTYYYLKGRELGNCASVDIARKYLQRFLTPQFATSKRESLVNYILINGAPLYMLQFLVEVVGCSFTFNEFLVAKLEIDEHGRFSTNLYVNGRMFTQCKFLLFNLTRDNEETLREIRSVDEAKSLYGRAMEGHEKRRRSIEGINPYIEFIGHASNLQVWIENNFDSTLLEKTLAFPLLKALVDAGCKDAMFSFREEIARRFEEGIESTRNYLEAQGYLRYLKYSELETLYQATKSEVVKAEMDRKRDPEIFRQETVSKLREFIANGETNVNHYEFCELLEDFREFSEEELEPVREELSSVRRSCQKCCEDRNHKCSTFDFLNSLLNNSQPKS